MNTLRHSTLATALVVAFASFTTLTAFGQSSAPPGTSPTSALTDPDSTAAAARGASAPRGPRLRSAAETANRAAAPGDLRPEHPVTPQINVPFGKKAAPSTQTEDRAVRRGSPAPIGGIDDAAARCESQTDAQLLAACRAKLAREAKGKLSI